MAVPSAVRKQREKLEAELGMSAADPSSSVPPEVTIPPVTEEAVPQVEQPVVAQPNAQEARIAELEQLLRTRDGQASKAMQELNEFKGRFELVASQVAALEEANATLVKQKETAEAFATAKRADSDLPSLDDVPELSSEEVEKFGSDSVSFVSKLSKRELLSYVKPLVAKVQALEKSLARLPDLDKLPQLEKSIGNVQAESQRVKDEEFFRTEVLAYFPDFVKVREAQEWKEYLATDVPGKGYKIGHMLNHYRLSHDAPNIRSIIQGYYDRNASRPNLSSLAVPSKTQTEGSPVVKPKLKASQYKEKLTAFTQRRLPKVEWEQFKTEFNTAMVEGRVEMDARL